MHVSKLQYDVKRTRLHLTATLFLFKTKENNRSLLIRKGFIQYTFCPKHLIMGNKIKNDIIIESCQLVKSSHYHYVKNQLVH